MKKTLLILSVIIILFGVYFGSDRNLQKSAAAVVIVETLIPEAKPIPQKPRPKEVARQEVKRNLNVSSQIKQKKIEKFIKL